MFDQLLLMAQLAMENVNVNEVKSIMNKVSAMNESFQQEHANSMINTSANALLQNS